MKITMSERFLKDLDSLSSSEEGAVFSVIIKLPKAVRDIHRHLGVGLRKVHPSGVYEARVGLEIRLIFTYDTDQILLRRAGNHDEIRRYLKAL